MPQFIPNLQRMADTSAFCPRDTAEGVVFKDAMWMSNGYCEGGELVRDLWRSTDGVGWDLVSDDTPYDGYAEMAVYKDKIWAVKNSAWNSDDGENWKQIAAATPFGTRGYGELMVFQDKMWQLGSGRDVWNTTDGTKWECACSDAPYGARYGTGVEVYNNKLWLLGGAADKASDPAEKHYTKYTTYNDVWCSEDGKEWTRVLEHAPWAERMWCVAAVYAGRLWLLGGFSNRDDVNFSEVWYTEDGATWQEYKSDPMFSARHEVTPYIFKGSLWIVAGNAWPLVNDVWKLDLGEG